MKEMKQNFGKRTGEIRNSNVELLRIIAMFTIITAHYVEHGAIDVDSLPFGFEKFFLDTAILGKLGVAIFVMITGYYLSRAKYNIKRVISVILQTVTCSATIFVAFCLVDFSYFSIREAVTDFFPVMMAQYWFVTAYVILSFIMPFLNKLINTLKRRDFLHLLVILGFFFAIAPTFVIFDSMSYGGYMASIILYYLIGAYLGKYQDNLFSKKANAILSLVVSFVLLICANAVKDIYGLNSSFLISKVEGLFSITSVFLIIISASMLSLFVNMKPHYSRTINLIGSCTFGVYLLHDHDYMRILFWHKLFNNSNYENSYFIIVHMLYSVVAVFVICSIVELFRKYILEKHILKKLYAFVEETIKKIMKAIDRVIDNALIKNR